MNQVQTVCVERLPRNQRRRFAIKIVAENRMTDGCEMDAKLMRAACDWLKLDQRSLHRVRNNPVSCNGELA